MPEACRDHASSSATRSIPQPGEIDWTSLSERGIWIARYIALPMACGSSKVEVARRLRTSPSRVSQLLAELADEISEQTASPPDP